MNIVKKLLLLMLLALPFVAGAQFDLPAVTDQDVAITVSPEIPGPNENVTITLSSFSVNLNDTKITWSVGGSSVSSGQGKTTFSFTSGPVGTRTTIDIAIIFSDINVRVEKRIIIEPSDLDLLWEAPESYTPPFYKGKALPSQEGIIQVAAMPARKNTSIGSQKNLSYTWKRNDKTQQQASGVGKQVFAFKQD